MILDVMNTIMNYDKQPKNVPGSTNAVGKVRRHEAVVAVHGGSPVGVLDVVADACDRPVSRNLALGSHEEVRTIALDDGLGRVNEGKPVGDGVLAEAVLLGQVATGLVDDGAEIADGLGVELAVDGRKADAISGGAECTVHSLVGDAGVAAAVGSGRGTPENAAGVVEGRRATRPGNDECTAGIIIARRWGRGWRRAEGSNNASQ